MEHLKIKDKCKSDVTFHNLFSNSFRVCKFLWKITFRKEIKRSWFNKKYFLYAILFEFFISDFNTNLKKTQLGKYIESRNWNNNLWSWHEIQCTIMT